MATRKQKQELIDTLKFTPVRVNLLIQGYGGEAYAGTVDRKIYDYFAHHRIDLDEYASDWDDQFSDIPADMRPFDPGSAYDCDNLWHASGAELSNLNEVTITDENGRDIWSHNLGYSELEDSGVSVDEAGGTELADLDDGTVVFWGGQGEKGCFFDAEFTLTAPFDPKKLRISYENCDDWYIITGVEYNGEELDGSGGYSTTGKWAENKWIIVGGEEVYESVPVEEREEGVDYTQFPTDKEIDELAQLAESEKDDWDPAAELDKIIPPYTVTDWFDKTIKPVRKGDYEVLIDAPWPAGGPGMAEWTGRAWKHNGEKVKIHQWRGITEDLG